MTIERDNTLWDIQCDSCPWTGTEDVGIYHTFQILWENLKEDGWEAVKDKDGEWTHRCPDCAEEGSQEALEMFKRRGGR